MTLSNFLIPFFAVTVVGVSSALAQYSRIPYSRILCQTHSKSLLTMPSVSKPRYMPRSFYLKDPSGETLNELESPKLISTNPISLEFLATRSGSWIYHFQASIAQGKGKGQKLAPLLSASQAIASVARSRARPFSQFAWDPRSNRVAYAAKSQEGSLLISFLEVSNKPPQKILQINLPKTILETGDLEFSPDGRFLLLEAFTTQSPYVLRGMLFELSTGLFIALPDPISKDSHQLGIKFPASDTLFWEESNQKETLIRATHVPQAALVAANFELLKGVVYPVKQLDPPSQRPFDVYQNPQGDFVIFEILEEMESVRHEDQTRRALKFGQIQKSQIHPQSLRLIAQESLPYPNFLRKLTEENYRIGPLLNLPKISQKESKIFFSLSAYSGLLSLDLSTGSWLVHAQTGLSDCVDYHMAPEELEASR